MAGATPRSAAPAAPSNARQTESASLDPCPSRPHSVLGDTGSAYAAANRRLGPQAPVEKADRARDDDQRHGRSLPEAQAGRADHATAPSTPRPHTAGHPAHAAADAPDTVRLAVHAPDSITQFALVNYIRRQPNLVLTGWGTPADVVVATLQNPDNRALIQLQQETKGDPLLVVIAEGDWSVDPYATLEAGVRAVLFRAAFTWERFGEVLRQVQAGHGDLPAVLQGQLMDQMRQTHREVLVPRGLTPTGLTLREAEVLQLVAEGDELQDIGYKLGYSERTIKNVLYGVMKRHRLRNRAHAVAYAIKNGLI